MNFTTYRTLRITAALLLTNAGAHSATVDELLAKGARFDQTFEATEALKCYNAAEKLDPNNSHVLACIARQYRHLMQDAGVNSAKQRLGKIAVEYSERAAALGPNDAEAQLSVAISYGKLLPFLSKREQVETPLRIKQSVDKTLALDPRNDTAWHILGRWNRVLADVGGVKRVLAGAFYGNLPKGSNEEAERSLKKAIALNPNRLMHYIELGRIYAQMGRNEDARRLIKKGLAMPNVEKDDPEMKDHGRETLTTL